MKIKVVISITITSIYSRGFAVQLLTVLSLIALASGDHERPAYELTFSQYREAMMELFSYDRNMRICVDAEYKRFYALQFPDIIQNEVKVPHSYDKIATAFESKNSFCFITI